jgi:hypothetical protein
MRVAPIHERGNATGSLALREMDRILILVTDTLLETSVPVHIEYIKALLKDFSHENAETIKSTGTQHTI